MIRDKIGINMKKRLLYLFKRPMKKERNEKDPISGYISKRDGKIIHAVKEL